MRIYIRHSTLAHVITYTYYTGFDQILSCDNILDQTIFTASFAVNNIVKAASVA